LNNSNIHIIDYRKLAYWLTPLALRKPIFMAWLRALIYPIEWLYDRYIEYRRLVLFKISITSSVCRLEYMLNYLFYPDGLDTAYNYRIIIENASTKTPTYLYLGDGGAAPNGGVDGQPIEENIPVYLNNSNPVYLYTAAELGIGSPIDYVVKIPTAVYPSLNIAQLNAWLEAYHLPDKNYTIETY